MTIDPATGQVSWLAAQLDLDPVAITIRATNDCGSGDVSYVLRVSFNPGPNCGFTLELQHDFATDGNPGGTWIGGVKLGEGSTTVTQQGLCMFVPGPGPGSDVVVWVGPQDEIELKDNTVYRVRMTMTTDQLITDAIPLWAFFYDNYHASGLGNNYGGLHWFLDVDGGASGIGRPNAPSEFQVWFLPNAAITPQWRGTLNDGTIGAFDPSVDAFNDMRIGFQILRCSSAGINANADFGTICIQSVIVESLPLDCLAVQSTVYNPPINTSTHAPHTITQNPLLAEIDNAAALARYQLNPGEDNATLLPAVQNPGAGSPGPGFTTAGLYPVIWEDNVLYRITTQIQSGAASTETDPVDAIFVNYDTVTNEQGGFHFTTRGVPATGQAGLVVQPGLTPTTPNIMFRSASPRLPATAGGPQTYMSFFYSNNATDSLVPDANRLRPLVSLFNTEPLFGLGTGSDPLEILSLNVDKMMYPGQVTPP